MRFIDDNIGMFLCRFLGVIIRIKRIFIPRSKEIPPEKVRTILCQKYLGIGSTLNAIPLMKAIREKYPNAKIIFLTSKSNGKVVSLCKMADEVLIVDLSSFATFTRDMFRNMLYILRQRIDISIDLEFFAKFSMLVSILALSKVRVGLYHLCIRPGGILTHPIYYNPYKHISEIYFTYAVVLAGVTDKRKYFSFPLLPSFRDSLENPIRKNLGLKENKPIITVNVNAGELFIYRRWPARSFIKLLNLLVSHYPSYYYVLTGGESDVEYVKAIYEKVEGANGNLINAAGRTSMEELFTLIEMSFLMVSNDSGPMHIASLYGINTTAFFGPETPIVYGPLNKNSLVFVSSQQYCSPCMSVYDSKKCLFAEKCADNICLSAISPEYVFSSLEDKFLRSNQDAK